MWERALGRRYANLGPLYGLVNYKKGEMAMGSGMKSVCAVGTLLLLILGCASLQPKPPVDRDSVEPGSA